MKVVVDGQRWQRRVGVDVHCHLPTRASPVDVQGQNRVFTQGDASTAALVLGWREVVVVHYKTKRLLS
jgi:hypothetical protein